MNLVGIFGKRIERIYAARAKTHPNRAPLTLLTPWSDQSSVKQAFTGDALAAALKGRELAPSRDVAMRVPGVARAHDFVCGQFASIPFFQMNGAERTEAQPRWLTTSDSGVAPYHRMYGAASDWFFDGWACFGFTTDMDDCFHIPTELWDFDDTGEVIYLGDDTQVDPRYTAKMIAVPLGRSSNGLLVNGADTIDQARKIEAAYQARLDNPIPLTVLTLDADRWDGATPAERAELLEEWMANRQKHSTAMKPSWIGIDMPGQVQVDLYETGRNGVRIDLANHVGLPASLLDGVRQGGGGGGTEMRYQGVAEGAARGDLWDFGPTKRMLNAFEARMSLDDVVEPGLSIRGDQTHLFQTPTPNTNPSSED